MDAPLLGFSIEEQRGVVRFLWAEGVNHVEIHRRMLAQYGQSTMSKRKVYEWVERFKWGRTRVNDGRSGRPSTSCTQDHIDRVDAMIREDVRITVPEVAAHLDISYGSAYAILHLGYRKVCTRWVLREFTVVQKRQRVEVATQLVRRYEEDPCVLERIVTGVETRVNHCDPGSKRQRMEWRHPSSSTEDIQKTTLRQESHVNAFLGRAWAYSGAFLSTWTNSEQC